MNSFKIVTIAIIIFLYSNFAFSQSDRVANLLKSVAQGKADEARAELPRLQAEFPDEPGVMLLQAVLMEDGIRAMSIYRKIVMKYPNSMWADDAQWRIVQFYAIIGDTLNAKKELEFFRVKYPKSEFLAPATDVVSSAIGTAKFDFKNSLEQIAINQEESKLNPPNPPENIRYGLQVGVYSTIAAAESEKRRFLTMKLRTNVIEKEVQGTIKYAVVIGDYATFESAESAKKEVEKRCSCSPIIFRKN